MSELVGNPISADYKIGIRSRRALWWVFFVMGIVAMAWVPRIPELKTQLNLSDGQFGLVLLGSTFGAIPGAQIAGRVIHTFGSRIILIICGFIMPTGLLIMALSHGVAQLMVGLFILGIGYSSLDVGCNTQAVAIEKITGTRSMSSFHGMWSVGAFATGMFGGAVTKHLSPRENLLYISIASFVFFIIGTFNLLPSHLDGHQGEAHEETEAKVPLFGKEATLLWGLGFGLVGALVSEMSASDWSGILLRDHMGISKGYTASVFVTFALAMIVSRFLGDHWLEHYGPERTVRVGGYLGGLAMALGTIIAVPLSHTNRTLAVIVICIGFAIAGLGIGPMYPAYMLKAGSIPGVAPSVGIARLGLIAIFGYFAGPTITGGIAQATSLPIAMMFPAIMMLLAGYQARLMPKAAPRDQMK